MQIGMPLADLLKTVAVEPAQASQAATPLDSSQPFGSLLRDAIGSVQNLETQATQATEGLMRGDGIDIHTAMIATQKADLAFEMALSVRNKAVAAYQQIMNMQF